MLTAVLLLSLGCATSTTIAASVCEVSVSSATPAAPLPGEAVVLSASPLTTAFDTAVYVGGQRALVTDVARSGCDDCDDCRETYGCAACGDCDSCDRLCSQTCEETVALTLPAGLAAGTQPLHLFNAYGSARAFPLTIAPLASDTGASDTGTSDTGTSDTGAADSGG